MELVIRNTTNQPIYDQIYSQIKAQIIAGKLSPGEALPSIRALAKDLRISVITTKRAYDELEADGFLFTVAGKGCFVAEKNLDLIREQKLKELEDHLDAAVELAAQCGISSAQLQETMNAIELSHVCKHFPGFSIQDLTFAVPSGTICGLVGENGAGKSTTIRLLMGALRPDSGTCSALGVDTSSPEFLAIKEDVGVVLDEAYFPEVLNADQVGRVMTRTYQRWDAKVYAAYLRRFDLPLKKAFKDFSRGMRMKLSIAVALSHSPKLLMLDEATAGLDPIVRDEVLEIFNEFTREEDHSILISSHILSDLEKLCDYIAFLHQGRLLFCEEKDFLLDRYGLLSDTAERIEALQPEAVVAKEPNGYGGVRCLVRRDLAPTGFQLERPTVEDIILFLVKGAKEA